ncbi:unnamed protein product [Aphanomyces euteiches]
MSDDYAEMKSPLQTHGKNDKKATKEGDKKPKAAPMASFMELFQFADATDKLLMAVGTTAAIVTGASQPIQIIFFGDIINNFNPARSGSGGQLGADFQKIINHGVYQFLAVGAIILGFGFLQVACWTIAASRQSKRLRHAYASAILRQEIGWFDVHNTMQLATRVADSTLLVQEGMGRKVADGINFLSMGLGSMIVAFIHGWELALILLAFTPLLGASAFCMTNAITAAVHGGSEAYAQAGGIAEESLRNIKTVHMFNAMGSMVDKYTAALLQTQRAGVRKSLAVGFGTGMTNFFLLCAYAAGMYYAVGMYYGTVLITKDQMGDNKCTGRSCYDAGRVIIISFCIVDGAMGLGQAGPSIQAMTTARSAAYDIFQLIRRQSKIDASSTEGKQLDHVDGHITLENVRCAYPSRPDVEVAAGYSLSIPAGQKIALVGSSGCGKSTIVSLLERFYDPLEGRVTLDGHDLKDLNVKWLRDQIGLVGQEPCLFSDTIADNIRRGKPGATNEEVYEAAKRANAYDFIMGFPMGFDTAVGDRGAQLSGGQKQRIAIARAIIKNPADVVSKTLEITRKISAAVSVKNEVVQVSETNIETFDDDGSAPDVPLSRVWALSLPDLVHLVGGSISALFHGGQYPIWGVLLTKCLVVFYRLDLGSHGMRVEAFQWSMGFIGLGAVLWIATAVQHHQFAIVCERLTMRIRGMRFRSMLRQDIGWFDDPKNSSGALTTRLATDSAAIRSMTAVTLNSILMTIATVAVAVGIGFYFSWRMTLMFMAVFPFMAAAQSLRVKVMTSQTGKDINDGDVKAGALLSEAISAVRTIASFNLENATSSAYLKNLDVSAIADRKDGLAGGFAYSVSQSSMIFAQAAIFYYGGWLMTHGLLNFQSMFMVLNSFLFCSFGVGMASQGLGDVAKAKKAVKSIFAIIDRQPPIDCTADDGIKLSHVSGDIELRGLDFCYPSRPDSKIYSNYNLKIKSGQTVALVGGSGSGKSTAINLIERFYDPNAGAVYLDGVDLKSINVQSLRNHISIVSQEPVLFVGTIGENIATGKPGATQAEIEDAAKKANAHDFIMQFPDGYNTSVGDRGVQVSGGQKQRIAIARAIIRDPEILLLDEATSALDNESERIVQASLDALLQQKRRTTVIVAHRLSTIRNADVIAVTDGGRIAELGTHNELIAIPNGIYANLVARQMQ